MKRLATTLLFALLAAGPALADEPRPSAGCGKAPAASPELLAVDGQLRHAIIVIPDDYRADRPHALVFGFHGRTNSNERARRYFDLERSALQPTIFVYPAGLKDDSGRYTWWELGEPATGLRDFRLFERLLEQIGTDFCLDLDAVHVVGHSLGANFANSLACARGGVIRSVVTVAGGINQSECAAEVAAMLLHNPRDELVPIAEGERARDTLLGDGRETGPSGQREVGEFDCTQYRDGAHPLLWCPHHQDRTGNGRDYPHQWPEGTGEAIGLFIDSLSGETLAAAPTAIRPRM
jgi:polyhydroxybutyrate depolymerase